METSVSSGREVTINRPAQWNERKRYDAFFRRSATVTICYSIPPCFKSTLTRIKYKSERKCTLRTWEELRKYTTCFMYSCTNGQHPGCSRFFHFLDSWLVQKVKIFAQNINKFVLLKIDFDYVMTKVLRRSKLHTKLFRQNKHNIL